jgi:hypothetical protein
MKIRTYIRMKITVELMTPRQIPRFIHIKYKYVKALFESDKKLNVMKRITVTI